MARISYWYLITMTTIFVVAHFLGALGASILEYSQPMHVLALFLSLLLLVGLLYKSTWAFRFGIFFYAHEFLKDVLVAYLAFVDGKSPSFFIFDSLLTLAVLLILIFHKRPIRSFS